MSREVTPIIRVANGPQEMRRERLRRDARLRQRARRVVVPKMPVVRRAPRSAPSSRRSRTTHRARAPSARLADDEPHPPRACEECGASLAGRNKHAQTCSARCRKALQRRREREALVRRHEAAVKLAKKLPPSERIDLLAAVV